MVVVTDTSPINYLILTGYVDVLPVLHGDVVIPQAVAWELRDPRTPERVRQWIAAPSCMVFDPASPRTCRSCPCRLGRRRTRSDLALSGAWR